MATLRTPEEIRRIVKHCMALEDEGGDVLGFLASENYISPRATWINFQRQYMQRKPYEFTDGTPTGKRRRRGMFKATEQIKAEAVKIALEGGNPKEYLENQGCQDVQNMWSKIKRELKELSPEIWEKLPARIGVKPQPMKVKLDSKPAEPEMLGPELAPEVKAGTVPMRYDGYDVCCIRGKYGEFYYDKTHGYLDWRTNDGEEVSMKPEDWMEFASEEVQKIMGILGAMPKDEN